MDTPTHGLIGRLVARSVWPGKHDNGLVNLATLCSVLPDADVFIPGGPLERLQTHRGFSHSIVGAAVIAGVVTLAARRFGLRQVPTKVVYLASLGGMLCHILFDWFTSYGTMVFEPFSNYRAASDVLFIIDPYLTLMVIAGLVLGWRVKASAYRTGAVVMTAYVLMNASVTGLGIWHVHRWADTQNLTVDDAASLPVPFSPLWRRGVLVSGDTTYDLSVFALEGVTGTPASHPNADRSAVLDPVWHSDPGSIYRWFARYPVVVEQSDAQVVVQDLRFMVREDGLGWLGTLAARTAVDHNPDFFKRRRFALTAMFAQDGSVKQLVYDGSPLDGPPDTPPAAPKARSPRDHTEPHGSRPTTPPL